MTFNHTNQNQQFFSPNTAQGLPLSQFQQNVQPLFPQPQGNVYNINSTLEVANVPVGAGVSVALCLNEGLMYIKTMQNGNPLFWAYKITPFDTTTPRQENASSEEKEENDFAAVLKEYDNRFVQIEQKISELQGAAKKSKGEWAI